MVEMIKKNILKKEPNEARQQRQEKGRIPGIRRSIQNIQNLTGRNRTKHANFRGSPLFQEKKKTQLIQLVMCQLDVGGWRKE